MIYYSEKELVSILMESSEEKDINIRLSDKVIFVKLVLLIQKNGVKDTRIDNKYYIQLTIKEMIEEFGYSLNVIRRSLNIFEQLGLIKRIGGVLPYKTYLLDKKFYLEV